MSREYAGHSCGTGRTCFASNGTLVGGLVGLVIYTVWHLWH